LVLLLIMARPLHLLVDFFSEDELETLRRVTENPSLGVGTRVMIVPSNILIPHQFDDHRDFNIRALIVAMKLASCVLTSDLKADPPPVTDKPLTNRHILLAQIATLAPDIGDVLFDYLTDLQYI